ncbi:IclR family transcriptional regulator [Actinorhabdospora filicis]|uniref:IclR family transcriptional regulator n=1 Tax=Actinorhabdospora filicis TaxID=1785913 RepID=UPI002554116F|nr:helix-turn-helix domain-containing protein [Actinorhabdospora filicis]
MDEEVTAGGRGVLAGAFALLAVLARGDGPVGLSELARRAGVPKPTAHRLLTQLAALGAVERHGDRYVVGRLVAVLGGAWRPYPGLRDAIAPVARKLAAVTGAPVAGVCLDAERRERLIACSGDMLPRMNALGFNSIVPEDAASKLLLKCFDAAETEAPLSRLEWRRVRASVSDRGFLVASHTEPSAVRCVAAPVFAPDGRVVAVVSTMVPGTRLPSSVPDTLVQAATDVGRRLGPVR